MLRALSLAVIAASLATGCAVKRPLQYDVDDVPRLDGGPLADRTLRVDPFEDAREADARARRGGSYRVATVERDDDEWYCNSDDRYDAASVAAAIGSVVAEHVRATHLFDDVVFATAPDAPAAQYVLSGRVVRFDGCRRHDPGKEFFVSQMGLIGLVIMATAKVPYEGATDLEVRLVDAATGATVWEGTAHGETRGTEAIDAYGWTAFDHAGVGLRSAVDDLVRQLAAVRLDAPPVVGSTAGADPAGRDTP